MDINSDEVLIVVNQNHLLVNNHKEVVLEEMRRKILVDHLSYHTLCKHALTIFETKTYQLRYLFLCRK